MASKARDLSNFISVATIDATEIATNAITTDKVADTAITHAKLHTTMDLSGKTVSFAVNQISGNAIDGGVISNFTSTGVDDNATSTKLTVSDTGIDVTGTVTADGLVVDAGGQVKTWVGTAAVPAHSFTDDSDTGMYRASANGLGFSTGGSQKMLIDSSGNVGIGSSTPTFPLEIQADGNANTINNVGRSDNISQITFTSNDKSTDYFDLQMGPTQLNFQGRGNIPMTFKTDLTERMRIRSDGTIQTANGGFSTDTDFGSVVEDGTFHNRRSQYHGAYKTHAGQTFKFVEGATWQDALKIYWNNSSWGGVNLRIKGEGTYTAGTGEFDVVIGLAGHAASGSTSYNATSNAAGNWTAYVQITQSATAETLIQIRSTAATLDVVYMFEWATANRSNQEIRIVEQ